MERPKRLWLILGIGLCVGLILFLRWAKFSDDVDRAVSPAALSAAPVTAPSPAPAQRPSQDAAAIIPAPAIEGGSVLRGRAFDAATREAVEAFEVQLRSMAAERLGKAETISRSFRSNTGRFEWKTAPVGTWRVMVIAKGYQRFELSELRIVKGKSSPEIVAPLIPGHRVTGRVFDQASGAPLGSARIVWREAHVSHVEGTMRQPNETSSKQDGSFVLDGVPSGRITVTAFANEYAYREIDVVTGEETPKVEIGLGRGGVISGQLTTADGTAVAGFVTLNNLDTNVGQGRPTRESGEFSYEHLPAGRYRLIGNAGGTGAHPLEVVLAENERMDSIMLALASGRSVRGMVRGVQPEWLHAVRVELRSLDVGATFRSKLDDHGAFALHGVPVGSARLTVHVLDHQRSSQFIDVPANTDLTLTIDIPRGTRLSGRVTQGGIPRSGNFIMAQHLERSDAVYTSHISETGAYEMAGLAPGEYVVQVQDAVVRRIRITGDTVLDIELPSTQLAGHVLEEDSSVPIVSSHVYIGNAEAGPTRVRAREETDHSGRFNLVGLEPGELLLSVYKPGYEMFRERVAYGAPIAGMTIRLRRSSGVEITALDADTGRAVRELYLSERIGDAEGIHLSVRLDERGAGSLPSALAGSTLTIAAQGYTPEIVREWNAQPIELRLKRR